MFKKIHHGELMNYLVDFINKDPSIIISLAALLYSHWIYTKQKPKIKLRIYPSIIPCFTLLSSSNSVVPSCQMKFAIPVLIENSGQLMSTLVSGKACFYHLDEKNKLVPIENSIGFMHLPKNPFSIQAGQATLKNLNFNGTFNSHSFKIIKDMNLVMKMNLTFLNHKKVKLTHTSFSFVENLGKIDFN